ncbi:endopeptidase La [Desulfobaculum senezii]
MLFGRRTEDEEEGRGERAPQSELRTRIDGADLPPAAREAALAELKRLETTDPSVAEYPVGVNYIEFVLSLPWNTTTSDNLDPARVAGLLESRHYGLTRVKERVAEYLAVKSLRDKMRGSVLVVDDEPIARENVGLFLQRKGYETTLASSGEEAAAMIEDREFDIVITDLKMGPMDGMTLLDVVRRKRPETQIIIVTGYATVDNAVDALRRGAEHYLSKPLDMAELDTTVAHAMHHRTRLRTARGPVLCFAGPPGTGKTSIGRAVAQALGRTFVRFSLGGVRDEAEFRGHRRTYVGAMPGRILKEIERCGVNNPVFMLDEIDKLGNDEHFKGDASSVLLEVLDPEQNAQFMDHYLDIPFDLSQAMFIATANMVEHLPRPLLDRLEIIHFPSYTEGEKAVIAKRHMLPNLLRESGLAPDAAHFTDAAVDLVLREYTQEAGLRSLRRELASVCRRLARRSVEEDQLGPFTVDEALVRGILGPARRMREVTDGTPRVGVAIGMVCTEFGGEIISVETARMQGAGQLILTGSLGEVLRESARLALSYVQSNHERLGIAPEAFQGMDVHVHIPAGSVSKDGPSAGVPIVMALISLFTGRPARGDVALSGELSLVGRLLPVAGIREKLVAAERAGVRTVILPARNAGDVEALEPEIRDRVELVLAEVLPEVVDRVLLPAEG